MKNENGDLERIVDFLFNNWLTTFPIIWFPGSLSIAHQLFSQNQLRIRLLICRKKQT